MDTPSQDPRDWIGRQQTLTDTLRPQPARFLQATLDRDPTLEEGDFLPPLWHWLYCHEAHRPRDLGRDAHPRRGGFLPPVVLPRRMWAGGRLTFHMPLILGQDIRRTATVQRVDEKTGRSGPLCFVTVQHQVWADGTLAITEEQDLVFRNDPVPGETSVRIPPAPDGAAFSREVTPTPTLLFRYSALTFNGHRIHYDADYARDVEGYDGLVFHGPLIATLLADLATEHGGPLRRFQYRGVAPITGSAPFHLSGHKSGHGATLWAHRDSALCMSATAEFAP